MPMLSTFLLCLLSPVLAVAQPLLGASPGMEVHRSPAFWYWIVALIVAAAAFAVVSVRLSRRRGGGPPSTPRVS
ncbi:MAG TPA: hypothetical protein VF815_00185 [Myxococcaceae bacterium]|jgi:anti-sigma-K factor RskA